MKKIFCLSLILLSISASAFAAKTAITSGTTVTAAGTALYGGTDQASLNLAVNPIAKASTGVSMFANFNSGGYSIHTKHLQGSKAFGTANDSTNIYWKASPSKVILNGTSGECGTTIGDANFAVGTGWTSY